MSATPDAGGTPAPAGPTGPKKKGRPSKNARQAARTSGSSSSVPTQPHPSSSVSNVDKGKSFAAAASTAQFETSAPSFRPGSFPVVFNASAPEASVDVWFTPDIPTAGEHASLAYEALSSSDTFVEFLANAGAINDTTEEVLASQFEGAGILCAAQSICMAHQAAGLPVGDFSPITGSDLVHIRSVRQIMAQYGDVRIDRVGQRYSVHHYTETVKAFIRQAFKAFNAKTRTGRQMERSCWWLPTAKGDSRTRFILAVKIAGLVKSKDVGFIPSCSWLEERIFPSSKGSPPVWLKSVLSEEEQDTLSSLWDVYPSTAQAFKDAFSKPEFLKLLGLEWHSPAASDLWWGVNFKEQVSKILDSWAARAPVLRKHFEVADKAIVSGTPGSTAQIGSTDTFRGVHIATFSVDNGPAVSSLAAAFLPRTWFCPSKETDVSITSSLPIGERAVAWIQKDFR